MKYTIVGGGVTGLVAGCILKRNNPHAQISIIEKENVLGGLLQGIKYNENGIYFDTGTHIFQETGNSVIDEILLNAVSPSDLIHFPVGKGDIAGVFFNGVLQNNSHFPDLRFGKVEQEILDSIRCQLQIKPELPTFTPQNSLLDVAGLRFGKQFTDQYVAPVFQSTFGFPASELSAFALLLTGWSRVIVDDLNQWLVNINNDYYRSLVGIPDQRKLPLNLHHGKKSFYSRKNGSRDFIDGLVKSLEREGVEIISGATITSIDSSKCSVFFSDSKGNKKKIDSDKLVLTNGLIGASKLFANTNFNKDFDRPMPHWIIDLILDHPCESDLCYLYGLDDNTEWYRVTNYRCLTGNSKDHRLTIEVLGCDELDLSSAKNIVIQLHQIGFLNSSNFNFLKVRRLAAGFPSPTVKNFQVFSQIGEELENYCGDNLLICGVGSHNGVFFQNEVLRDMFDRISNF
jgi:protoporphyrinogen oxidase